MERPGQQESSDQQDRLTRNRDFVEANRRLWEQWTPHHIGSELYNVEGFRAGADPLDRLVLETLGDVRGQSLLHLQCHFGLDSLALVRHGAVVTGVDFSGTAIRQARRLSRELDLPARFIESDVYDLPRHLREEFDVVFTSIGAICWLPDLGPWARVIAGISQARRPVSAWWMRTRSFKCSMNAGQMGFWRCANRISPAVRP